MKKYVKFLIVALLVFLPSAAWSACVADGANWASTPDYASVAECVTNADAGDTITVSAGGGTATWDTLLAITKGVNLIGPGLANLTVTNSFDCNHDGRAMITYTPADLSLNTPFRISGFTLDAGAKCHIISLNGKDTTTQANVQTKIRIDHNKFQNVYSSGSTRDNAITIALMYGVADNNNFSTIDYPVRFPAAPTDTDSWWNGINGVQFGAADNNFYFENNTFTGVGSNGGIISDCQYSNRYAFRYNTVTLGTEGFYQLFDQHGNDNVAGHYSCFGSEIYGNLFNVSVYGGQTWQMRGGKHLLFYNSYDAVSGTPYGVFREEYADSKSPTTNACPDNGGDLTCSKDGEHQHIDSTYIWNNRKNETGDKIASSINTGAPYVTGVITENAQFWQDAATFDGTVGTGCGTLAARPATCTAGVGYWATNQSCSDLTGMVGVGATPIAGTLYKCTATNTWTAYYTPYSYPHPLRGETTTYTVTPSTSTGCAVTPSAAETVNSGDTRIYTMTAAYGYSITGTGCTLSGSTCITAAVTGNLSVKCNPTPHFATLGGSGTITLGGSGTITLGN